MTTVLVLGATGRTGMAFMQNVPIYFDVYAAIRQETYGEGQWNTPEGVNGVRVIDLEEPASLTSALTGVDVVVNAIRLRGVIPPNALVDVHKRIVAARDMAKDVQIVHVGGAGSLRLGGGRRFWEQPSFPAVTLPRGAAHAQLRDYLETSEDRCRWAYLIPPPSYLPRGPYADHYTRMGSHVDERAFLEEQISYEDFSQALVDAVREGWEGTYLIGG